MKKMLIIALIALFYIAVSAIVPHQTVPVDKDVGYSLTIVDQNQILIPFIAIPVIGESQYSCTQEKLSLPNADYIINENQISQGVSNVANHSLIWQRAILINTSSNMKLLVINANNMKLLAINAKANQLRGVNTRLDIGETLFS